MRHLRLLSVILFICFCTAAWTQDKARLHFTLFDVPGAGTGTGQGTFSYAITPDNWITGYFTDASNVAHGYLRAPDGKVTTFDVPKSVGTYVAAINAELTVVGAYVDAKGVVHGFERSFDGRIATFDAPGAGAAPGQGTCEWSINAWGEISGNYLDSNDVVHSFVRDPGKTYVAFEAPGAGNQPYQGTVADGNGGLTNLGIISGAVTDSNGVNHGFLRMPDGAITEFDAPGAGSTPFSGLGTAPSTINQFNWIIGQYLDANSVAHGFVRAPNGFIEGFEAADAGTQPGQGTYGFTNNDKGAVVGVYFDSAWIYHGFVRTPQGRIIEFDAPGAGSNPNTPSGTGPYWFGLPLPGQGTEVSSINDNGAITGYVMDASSVVHGFVASLESK